MPYRSAPRRHVWHTRNLCTTIANLPDESITPISSVCEQGVYYGFAQVDAENPEDSAVHPMVMSLGWNPFYKNERLTAVRHYLCKRRWKPN